MGTAVPSRPALPVLISPRHLLEVGRAVGLAAVWRRAWEATGTVHTLAESGIGRPAEVRNPKSLPLLDTGRE